jgi:hypothetical protein
MEGNEKLLLHIILASLSFIYTLIIIKRNLYINKIQFNIALFFLCFEIYLFIHYLGVDCYSIKFQIRVYVN